MKLFDVVAITKKGTNIKVVEKTKFFNTQNCKNEGIYYHYNYTREEYLNDKGAHIKVLFAEDVISIEAENENTLVVKTIER